MAVSRTCLAAAASAWAMRSSACCSRSATAVSRLLRGTGLHALHLLAGLAHDALGLGGRLRQRLLGVGLGLQGLVAQPLGFGQRVVMSAARLSSRAVILVHRILPSRTTNSTKATATQVSGSPKTPWS